MTLNSREISWSLEEQDVGKPLLYKIVKKLNVWGAERKNLDIKKSLSRDRENNIRDFFVNENINFEYPNSIEEFYDLLDHFQKQKSTCIENSIGENVKLDRLIVMGNISGLADQSEIFSNLLTVSRKY